MIKLAYETVNERMIGDRRIPEKYKITIVKEDKCDSSVRGYILDSIDFDYIFGKGKSYGEAFEDFKSKFQKIMLELKEFEEKLFNGNPIAQIPTHISTGLNCGLSGYNYSHNMRIEQLYNDSRIVNLTKSPLLPEIIETVPISPNTLTCEVCRCKYNTARNECKLDYICASFVHGHILCISKNEDNKSE